MTAGADSHRDAQRPQPVKPVALIPGARHGPNLEDDSLPVLPGTRIADLVLEPEPAAVRHARAFVHEHCCPTATAAGPPDCLDSCDTLMLLVSELVTNAFLHGRSQTRLHVVATATYARVEVSDDNSRHPVIPPQDHNALDGRGMALVALLATCWGVRDEVVGKTVWFELHG